MHTRIDLLSEKAKDAYVFQFSIPYYTVFLLLLWLNFYNSFLLVLIGAFLWQENGVLSQK